MIPKLRLTLSPTATGTGTYLQVMSDDMLVNVVLVAGEIEVTDTRPKTAKKPAPKKGSKS